MLDARSIRAISVTLLAVACSGQYYNSDYRVNDDVSGEDGSSYDDKPDYSKYYKQDTSAPITAGLGVKESEGGFVSPLDFAGFFGAANFGFGSASNAQEVFKPAQENSSGFVDSGDFKAGFDASPGNFGEPQTFQKFFQHSSELNPGPSYVSQKVLPEDKTYNPKYSHELEDLNEKKGTYRLGYKPSSDAEEPEYKVHNDKGGYTKPYSTKSYPLKSTPLPKYVPKYTKSPSNLSPYQKYSFQPVSNLKSASFENIKSTIAPFRPSVQYPLPSTVASQYALPGEQAQGTRISSKHTNCKKVDRQVSHEDLSHGRFRRNADMNCYVCKDPKTGGSYEQCSYTSDPEEGNYFHSHAQKYSSKTQVDPDVYRQRRSVRDRNKRQKHAKQDEDAGYINPFEKEKKDEHQFNSKPDEFDSDGYYSSPDFSGYEQEAYRFGPEYFTDASNDEKSYSEVQSDELKKSGENCNKVKKDGMVCMVCSNPKTGGNYEQCSYSSEPQEKKYAYVKEKKYNSNEPDETEVESTEEKPKVQERHRKPKQRQFSAKTRHPKQKTTKNYEIPHHFEASTKKQDQYRGLDPELYGSDDSSDKKSDYVSKLFPEYAQKESRTRETKRRPGYELESSLPEYFTAEESKKDVDSVLAEFAKKDRSNCKKIARDKMTCYQCLDDKGVQHEECMFVSESQPKSSHIAYHEVKEFTSDPKRKEVVSESKPVETKTKKRQPRTTTVAPVEKVTKKVRQLRRKTNINKELLPAESKRQEVQIAPVATESPEGAYASDLVPRYSRSLGVSLPSYMLEVSEHEKIFDEVVKSG